MQPIPDVFTIEIFDEYGNSQGEIKVPSQVVQRWALQGIVPYFTLLNADFLHSISSQLVIPKKALKSVRYKILDAILQNKT